MEQFNNLKFESKKIGSILLVAALLMAAGCSKENNKPSDEVAVHTGHVAIEKQIAPTVDQVNSQTVSGSIAYVYAERLRARATPEVADNNIMGVLDINDQIVVLEGTPLGKENFIKAEVKASRGMKQGQIVYISQKFVSTKKKVLKTEEKQQLKYYMIQNVATETIRVYERCLDVADKNCKNKMVFQSEMVSGEDDDGTKSNVGIYKIERWEKFYEDNAKHYPAWYRPNYPAVPAAGASRSDWFDSDVMPNGEGKARGAFGWYTAIVGPNANAQWTHGTLGWGADEASFIHFKDGIFGLVANWFAAIRSRGCSRVENRAIAYLRHLLPVGSTLVKVYARETSSVNPIFGQITDDPIPGYTTFQPTWKYILTKKGYGKAGGQTADAATVIAEKTPQSEWLEQGEYSINQYPVVLFNNVYKISNSEFKGSLVVDEGVLSGYEHPVSMGRGGFKDQQIPNYMLPK